MLYYFYQKEIEQLYKKLQLITQNSKLIFIKLVNYVNQKVSQGKENYKFTQENKNFIFRFRTALRSV